MSSHVESEAPKKIYLNTSIALLGTGIIVLGHLMGVSFVSRKMHSNTHRNPTAILEKKTYNIV